MAGYTRQSTFADGDTITAALFNNEYNQLLNAFSNTGGHKHDGTANEGPVIGLIGDAGETSPNNKVLIDTTNNYIEFYVEVSSAPVQQLYIADGAIIPVTDSDVDLGTTSLRFKDTYTDTVTTTGNVSIGGDLTVTGSATISGNLTFGDADTDSINLAAEIDSDIIPNTDGTYDLGSATKEWQDLYIDGTANIDSLVADTADINAGTIDGATIATSDITVGAGKTLDVSAGTLTLADDQISGDKVEGGTIAATTITSLTATSADINGGTIDGVTIGGTTAGAVTFTDLSDGTITIAGFADEDNMVSNSATLLPTQQSVKAYVDSQVTAQDLDFQGDTGGALSIDLDSESLTIAGGTGLDTVGSGNTVTVNIDSTVATLTGSQTLTNKTLTTPIISSISNTGTLTLPTSTDTLVGRATTDTLTNKTLTSPVINTGVSGTAFLDDDTFATATASTLASSESIKAYVDTTVAATNEVVEDTTPQLGGDLDTNGNDILFGDNDKAIFGTGSDLEVYFDGFTAWFDNQDSVTKDTQIKVADGGYITLKAGTDSMIQAAGNSNVSLYYDNAPKLATTSTGIDVTGVITTDGLTTSGDINFGDNDKAIFGASDDLQIYHDGSSSIITESGTGNLKIQGTNIEFLSATGEDYANFLANGAVRLYYDNSTKLATTSTGIDVTGTVTADGLTLDAGVYKINNTSVGSGSDKWIGSDGGAGIFINAGASGNFNVYNNNAVARLGVNGSTGDISFYDDTGTSQAFFWDASEEKLGIGTTSSIDQKLTLVDTADVGIKMLKSGSVTTTIRAVGGAMAFGVDGGSGTTERMRIDSSGKVGIGTDSPAAGIHLTKSTSNNYLRMDDGSNCLINFSADTSTAIMQSQETGFASWKPLEFRANYFVFKPNNTEKMRLTGTGLGIGTSSINNPFSFNTATQIGDVTEGTSLLTLAGTTQGSIFFADGASGTDAYTGYIEYQHGGNYMSFGTGGGTERMRIDSSGNLLVGATSPTGSEKFTVSGNTAGAYLARFYHDGNNSNRYGVVISCGADDASGTNYALAIDDGDGTRQGQITFSGGTTTYGTSSDYRLKENIESLKNGLSKVLKLNPVEFTWKKNNIKCEGFIAHEVQEICKEAVSGEKDGEEMQGVDYGRITPLLVKAIQEQQTQIDALQSEINNLKGE